MPTLIVPDEQTWTMLGHDPAGLGATPSFRPGATASLLIPDRLPEELGAFLTTYMGQLSGSEGIQFRNLAIPGSVDTRQLLEGRSAGGSAFTDHRGHGGDEAGEMADGDAPDEMGDMMAIGGDPSADGLVMEEIELRYGPLAVPFPGGLGVEASLDGDVVSRASVSGLPAVTLTTDALPAPPDPLAPIAWTTTIAAAAGQTQAARSVVFGVELERAISHLAWLRSLSRLLGWPLMTRRTAEALAELTAIDIGLASSEEATRSAGGCLDDGAAAVSEVLALVCESRMLRWRLADRGLIPRASAAGSGLDGPNARASGLMRDVRTDDPLYAELGFEPLLEQGGDARDRALIRVREAAQSIDLARHALALRPDREWDPRSSGHMIEGPRGPIRTEHAQGAWSLSAPGGPSARESATDAMVGETWEDALATLASFDLTPWGGSP